MNGTVSFPVFARRQRARFELLCGFVLAFIYLYLTLFVPPLISLDLSFRDNGIALSEAMRILHGQIIYRDFFDVHFPGTQFFYALSIRLLGPHAWIPNASLLCLGIGFLWASIVISRRLLSGATALLPGVLFLCLSFHNYLDPTHHWYSNLLIVTAMAVLIEKRSPTRLTLAGGLSGLATVFSQNHGPLAALGFAAFVWWEATRDGKNSQQIARSESYFRVPFAAVFGVSIGYLALAAGARHFFQSTVLFAFRYWNATPDPNSWSDYGLLALTNDFLLYHHFPGLRLAIISILIPGIYLVAIVCHLRHSTISTDRQWRLIVLSNVVGLSLFASVINSATGARLDTISLPGFIVLVWLVASNSWGGKTIKLLWMFALFIMLRDISIAERRWAPYVDTPSGRVAVYSSSARSYYRWLAHNTRPGEFVFNATTHSGVYFLFRLENSTKLWWLTSCDYTRPEQVSGVLQDLEMHRVRLILWYRDVDTMGCLSGTDHLQPIRNYVRDKYRHIETFQDADGATVFVFERLAGAHRNADRSSILPDPSRLEKRPAVSPATGRSARTKGCEPLTAASDPA